jgi:hypothetical protein
MPYVIVKVYGGYKVKKDTLGKPHYFSRYPLTHEKALRQLRALYFSEYKK